MEKTYFVITAFIMITLLSVKIAGAQNVQNNIVLPDSCQFDFWVGEWNLEWKDANGNTQSGTNRIMKILNNYVVLENFSTSDSSFKGTSASVYNKRLGKWQQTWVDNSGAYLDFTGGFSDGKMILSRTGINAKGEPIPVRMVFFNITKNEFDWSWEKSSDNGSSWIPMWQIHYKRR